MDLIPVVSAIIGAISLITGSILAARGKRREMLNDRTEWEVRLILEQRELQVQEALAEIARLREINQRYAMAYYEQTGKWLWADGVPPPPEQSR